MHDVTVTFIGGSSGHFVANVAANMLYGAELIINDNGSAHDFSSGVQSDYYELCIDPDPDSPAWVEFEQHLKDMVPARVSMAHCMNLRLLSKFCRKLVYISFDESYLPLFGRRHLAKLLPHNAKRHYDALAGVDWPPYEEYLREPGIVFDSYEQCLTMQPGQWQWIMPDDTTNLHAVKFADLHNGEFLQPLADFLGTSYDRSYLLEELAKYNSKQTVW